MSIYNNTKALFATLVDTVLSIGLVVILVRTYYGIISITLNFKGIITIIIGVVMIVVLVLNYVKLMSNIHDLITGRS